MTICFTEANASGYFDDPEATRSTFRNGWFYSGDIGTVTEDGVLCVSGRTGEIINAGGVKVSPRAIEEVLRRHPDVIDAAAFPVRNAVGLVEPCAAVVARRRLAPDEMGRFCANALGTASPRTFLQVDNLPRNANGKVAMQVLIDLAQQKIDEMRARAALKVRQG